MLRQKNADSPEVSRSNGSGILAVFERLRLCDEAEGGW